ncbi:MAG: glucokinase [Acidimicrobiaceae bacterium]|nr:glucokinase [Acidimicrobiaceae bacterium]
MPAAVGIDVGGTKVLGVLLNEQGQVAAEHRVPTPSTADGLVDAVVAVVAGLGGSGHPVGVGVPGLVDHEGCLRFAPNLPGVVDVPVRARLHDALGVTVVVENDATAACWGERERGAAAGADDVVVVTLGTGIGGGVVAGGVLQRGAHGFAGEIGHMVVDPNGPRCPCGKRGCWERFASGSALGGLARRHGLGDRGEAVTAAALRGDPDGVAAMAEFAWWVAIGLVNLAYLLDNTVFVLGGGVIDAGEALLGPTREAFASLLAGAAHRPPVSVVGAALGERAGAIGAALLAGAAGAAEATGAAS